MTNLTYSAENFNSQQAGLDCRDDRVLRTFLEMSYPYINRKICTLDWIRLFKAAQTSVKILSKVVYNNGLSHGPFHETAKDIDVSLFTDEELLKQCQKFQSQAFFEEVKAILPLCL